ncbi:ABC transporter permease subunit [Pseudonocardia alaniniphila]|uniref:ABC transporter permease subunit n=1 Tax=Pseudonocardia alaniniphila TaxID=75291 RepID=A0ABS9TI18_9PSEU|nr:ABC transporter permease subunit [Pseudonocardia alaniniphila]MCH6168164.1 ABC transporter permease subunit [Pseudonocardia alaniniphila]
MTGAVLTALPGDAPRSAPLGRLLGAELRWVLRRPRTLVMLAIFALVPVLIAIGVTVADRNTGGDDGLISAVAGNGLVLPVVAMTLTLALLLPLAVAMAAADAIAGEAAQGTLRGLLIAPVGRLRLVTMKAFGVLVVATLATLALAVVGVVAGLVVVGGADGQLVTLSGTTVGIGEALARVALVVVWTVVQLAAVGAVALAISSYTEHPLVVMASVLGGLIVFGVLSAIPALDWLQPYLLTSGWRAGADALRDPLPFGDLVRSSLRALCYIAIGAGLTVHRMLRRDA